MKERIQRFVQWVMKHRVFVLSTTAIVLFVVAFIVFVFASLDTATAPEPKETTAESAATVAPEVPKEEAKAEVAKNPPKTKTSGAGIKGSTKVNSDGTKTVTISSGSVDTSDMSSALNAGSNGSSPYGISYSDQTGLYPGLETVLKNYIASNLRYSSELASMKQIIVKNAGDTGWTGLYSGSYTVQQSGDISSAYGWITLNTYYYKDSPYFDDYMKLVLSHEYGHHFTLYHKWVDWDLAMSVRFPDQYYSIRPLDKATTATDYSLGWASCDSEIIAEDYSYFYSGYGYHGMAGARGYPSAATKTFIANLPNGPAGVTSTESTSAPATTNAAPAISISSPANGATVSSTFAFSANATDDSGVAKVTFTIDGATLSDDSASPYSTSVNSLSYANGSHTLQAVATDGAGLTASASISVTINNTSTDTTNPTVSFSKPETNPSTWTSGNLSIKVSAADNVAISKIDLYINNYLVSTENSAVMSRYWSYSNAGAGQYTLKAIATDTSGNTAEASVVVNKQ